MVKRAPLLLAAILALALALRLWGLTWGLPTATHYYSYHPDESVVLGAAMSMNVFGGQILPHFYHYGSLQLYLVNIAATFASAYGGGSLVIKDLAHDWPQWAHQYLVGRVLTVLMGVGTVWGVYALGKELWGRRAGLIGAALLAVTPLHAQHSHWLTVDVPAAFWGIWALFWAARLMKTEALAWKPAVLAGLMAGFAVATKYNMALLLLPVAFAALARPGAARQKMLPLIAAFLTVGAAFLLTCPGAVLETDVFLHDVRFEAVHMQNVNDPTFHNTGNGFFYQITTNLTAGLGEPLLLFTLFSLLFASYKRAKEDGFLAAFALPYFVLISVAAIRYARYDIPLLPVLALWTGRLAAEGTRSLRPIWSKVILTVTLIVGVLTLMNAINLVRPMTQTDPRDVALLWLNQHAPSPAPVAYAAQPWFGTAPLSPYFSSPYPDFPRPQPGGWQRLTPDDIKHQILYSGSDWDIGTLEQQPNFVELDEYGYRDALRLHDPAAEKYLQVLRAGWQEAAVFGSAPRTMGLPVHALPHDMLYPDPCVVIFQRKP